MTDIKKKENPPAPTESPDGRDYYILTERGAASIPPVPDAPANEETLTRRTIPPQLGASGSEAPPDEETLIRKATPPALTVPELHGRDLEIVAQANRAMLTAPQFQGQQDLEISTRRTSPTPNTDVPVPEDDQVLRKQFFFDGKMDLAANQLKVKEGDYTDLQNLRYVQGGLQGVNGFANIVTTPDATYTSGRTAIQFRTPFTTKSYILAQCENAGETASRVLSQTTEPPGQGDFAATAVFADSSGAGLGRFSKFPGNQIGYCNGVDSCIWAGDEKPPEALFIMPDAATDAQLNASADVTEAARNMLESTGNTIALAAGGNDIWLVGSTRPLKGVKYYLAAGGANGTASTQSGWEWTGAAWSALSLTDGTVTGGVSFAKDGSVTFTSTVGTSKPRLIKDMMLYWYLFSLSAGSATLKNVTIDAPMQQVVDIWDGVPRPPVQFFTYIASTLKDGSNAVVELTPEGHDPWTCVEYMAAGGCGKRILDPYGINLHGMTSSDYFLVGFDEPVDAIIVDMFTTYAKKGYEAGYAAIGTVNTATASLTVQYNTGAAWSTMSYKNDGTSAGGKTLAQSGVISFEGRAFGAEKRTLQKDIPLYFYKIYPSATLTGTALTDMVILDRIQGVTSPKSGLNGYVFPFHFANRAMLCGKVDTNELNRVDYSATNAPDVWNGEDSSNSAKSGALYFGEGGELTAAVALYNRLGSNLYDMAVFCKHNETYMLTGFDAETWKIYSISKSIGCPAPLTMVSADIGLATGDEATRNVGIWVTYKGPVVFDGNSIIPIHMDISPYFDKTDDRCINYTYIERAVGWFDQDYNEYNLLIPSGASATYPNVWLCYDIVRGKWFRKDPDGPAGTPLQWRPQFGFPVYDANGVQYIYALFDSGYMKRMEYGAYWEGAVLNYAIDQIVETCDQVPTGNIWDKTKIRRMKVVTGPASTTTAMVVQHYADGATTPIGFTNVDSDSSLEWVKSTQSVSAASSGWNGWSHKFKFSVSTSTEDNGIKFLMWGYQYVITREDT